VLLVESAGPAQVYDGIFGGWLSADSWVLFDSKRVNETNVVGIYSFHAGGANVGLADASVHFLDEGVSPAVIAALLSRDGGEAIDAKAWQ
jgi:hypothetical protein